MLPPEESFCPTLLQLWLQCRTPRWSQKKLCITIFLLFLLLHFLGGVHYGHITCASIILGVGHQKISFWWGERLLWSICEFMMSTNKKSFLNFYISKMFCKFLSRSLLIFMFLSSFFTFLEIQSQLKSQLLCKLSQWVITALPYLIYNCYYLMILKAVKLKC